MTIRGLKRRNSPHAQLEQLPLAQLKIYRNHARKHPQRALNALLASIRQNGLIEPLVVDENDEILSGVLRYSACRELGFDEVPIIRITWLTPEEKRSFRIAANRIPELGTWDRESLQIELASLVEFNVDLDLVSTGFETAEIDLVLQHDDVGKTEEDPTPEPPVEPIARPGDLWQLGEHRLLCGSCLEESTWRRLMGDEKARLCLTDPPYNVRVRGHVTSGNHSEFAMASGEMSSDQFVGFLATACKCAIDCTADGGLHLIAMDWRHLRELYAAADPLYSDQLNLIVWAKTNAGMGSLYRSRHELWALYKVGNAEHVNNIQLGKYGRNRSNIWTYPGANTFRDGRDQDLAAHPTVKPTALVADAILDLTNSGEVVIDGFGGSGTLILAAEKTRRKARVIEIDPKYVDVAIRRWETMTGETAVLASTGEPFGTVGEARAIKQLPAPAGRKS